MIVEEKNLLFSEAKEMCSLGFLSFVPFFLGVGKCGGSFCTWGGSASGSSGVSLSC